MNLTFGIFQAYYEEVLLRGMSPSRIAWIGSFQSFSLFFFAIIIAPAINRGRFRSVFTTGSVSLFIGLLGTSFVRTYTSLMIWQGVITGMGMGQIFGSGVIVLSSYFSTHLGVASGLAAAGASMGTFFYLSLNAY